MTRVERLCQTAIEYARPFGFELDFSDRSIAEVEEILDYYSLDYHGTAVKRFFRRITGRSVTDRQLWAMASIFGAYIGETLLRNHLHLYGFIWTDENEDLSYMSGEWQLMNAEKTTIYPISKAYKRIKNGAEDNILSFYQAAVDMISTY